MALSDCERCWETPCSCGYEYRHWSSENLIDFVASVISYKPLAEQKKILEEAAKKLKEKHE